MSREERVAFAGEYDKRGNFNYCQWIENNLFCHKSLTKRHTIPYCFQHRKLSIQPYFKPKTLKIT